MVCKRSLHPKAALTITLSASSCSIPAPSQPPSVDWGLAVILLVVASSTIRAVLKDGPGGDPYSFTSPEPGGEYFIKFRKYKRYGPMLDQFNSYTDKLLDPETAIRTITIALNDQGRSRHTVEKTHTATGEL